MKIETKVNELKLQGIATNVASAFTVEVNDAHVFETLIQFYKQPISSIARELISNGVDAHVMAGCPDKPIYIQIPTFLNNNFVIRDFGTGIAPADFKHIYCRFFGSDKRQNNETIGGFGLGSKTPFAYTNNYTVTNYYDGIKYVYAFFINEDNIPQDVQVEAVETDEENGLSIEFCVQEKDFNAFIDAVYLASKHLKVKPESNYEFDWDDVPSNQEKLFEGDDWYCLKNNLSHYEKNYVVLGSIEYPVPSSDLNKAMIDIGYEEGIIDKVNKVLDLGVYLQFDIGTLRPIPSRESLMWIPKNTHAVVNRLLAIYDFIGETLTNEICVGTTTFENKYLSYTWFSKTDNKARELKTLYRLYAGISSKDNENVIHEVALNFEHYGIWDVSNHLSGRNSTITKSMSHKGGYANYGFFVKFKYLNSDVKIKIAVTSGKPGFKSALKEHGSAYHYVCLVDKKQAEDVVSKLEALLTEEGVDKYVECVNFDQQMQSFGGASYASYNNLGRMKISADSFQAKTISLDTLIKRGTANCRLDSTYLNMETCDSSDTHYYVRHSRNVVSNMFSGMTKEALLALELDDFDCLEAIEETSILWLSENELNKLEAKDISLINFSDLVYDRLKEMKSVCENITVDPVITREHIAFVSLLASDAKWPNSLVADSPLRSLINAYRESMQSEKNATAYFGKKQKESDLYKFYKCHFGSVSTKEYTLDFTKHEKQVIREHYPLLASTFEGVMHSSTYSYESVVVHGKAIPFIQKYVEECDHNARLKILGML